MKTIDRRNSEIFMDLLIENRLALPDNMTVNEFRKSRGVFWRWNGDCYCKKCDLNFDGNGKCYGCGRSKEDIGYHISHFPTEDTNQPRGIPKRIIKILDQNAFFCLRDGWTFMSHEKCPKCGIHFKGDIK